ncbi:MAG: preprotein translocase subunit YajC [Phycisphaerae bacterium]|nr:preprotein translocase subunit YajC [Phycisphaerae bacterium]
MNFDLWIAAGLSAAGDEQQGTVITSDPAETGQTTVTDSKPGTADPANKPAPPPPWLQWSMWILIFMAMYLLLFSPRRRQKQQEKMIKALQKNDRVRTVGGILGTVVEVRENEIVLKVDESTNTKIRVVPGAISKLASEDKN